VPKFRVVFKYEDELHGQPIGPCWTYDPAEPGPSEMRPYDPNAEPEPWVTLAQAKVIAAGHGVKLETV
jgi:hypothetical protein